MASHANCAHPATKAARAACRRQRGAVRAKTAATVSRANPKKVKALNGQLCSQAELKALRNVAERDCPAIKSNDTCRAIREKGFAYWNRRHFIWMLTPVGQELVYRAWLTGGRTKMSEQVKVAAIPDCDIHKYDKGTPEIPAVYDGATKQGPWAYMCEECFQAHGVGLGTGRGQRLILDPELVRIIKEKK